MNILHYLEWLIMYPLTKFHILRKFEKFDERIYNPLVNKINKIKLLINEDIYITNWLIETEIGSKIHQYLCMWNGHDKVIWYTLYSYEPDMHCIRCGEDLG